MALAKSQRSLRSWTKQKWRTKSGKKSSETGERYLPEKAIKSLSDSEYAATTAKKRKDTAAGKQHSKQPKRIAKKTRGARQFKSTGGLATPTTPYDGYYKLFEPQFNYAYQNNNVLKNAANIGLTGMIRRNVSQIQERNGKYYIAPTISFETGNTIKGQDVINQLDSFIDQDLIQGYDNKKAASSAARELISNLVANVRKK